MRVLMTGHDGYIGSVMADLFQDAGHDVTGFDSFLFEECTFGEQPVRVVPALRKDLRDVQASDLRGFDAVVHLAALSNDPLGNLDPECTYDINHRAAVRLAQCAKEAGVERFLFASSCSLYGVAGDELLTETAEFNPITPYGRSKVLVERDVSALADDRFSPVFLRNATAYGASPRLRLDLVVNILVASACATGEILLQSDGSPWRPLVHVEDISAAFVAVLNAPRELVHNQAFNVGATKENYQVRDIAEIVRETIPGSRVRYADGAGPDPRCYRVSCEKIAGALPDFRPAWTVRRAVEDLYSRFRRLHLTAETIRSGRYLRMSHIQKLQQDGSLDANLRRRIPAGLAAGAAHAGGRGVEGL